MCEGWIGEACAGGKDTTSCNSPFGYECAAWLENGATVGLKCQDPVNCDKEVTEEIGGETHTYSIACDGYLGETCSMNDSSSCNSKFGFQCADWVDPKEHTS